MVSGDSGRHRFNVMICVPENLASLYQITQKWLPIKKGPEGAGLGIILKEEA